MELTDPNQLTVTMSVNPSQDAVTAPTNPESASQYLLHTATEPTSAIDPSLLRVSVEYHTQLNLILPSHPSLQRQDQPPIYLTSNNIPVPVTNLEPPAYNYVAVGHPSNPNNQFINALLQVNTHRLAYILMDASSGMWIHACNNVIGKDGPMNLLIDRIIHIAVFCNLLKSPHLPQSVPDTWITVHTPETPSWVVTRTVPADLNDHNFMQALQNEIKIVPERIHHHFWACSKSLLQPSDSQGLECEGIFPALECGIGLDSETKKKLRWAFQESKEWGYGIFHGIVPDDNRSFRPGRWFRNTKFISLIQEGMYNISSPNWLGFIETPTNMNSS